MTHVIRSRFHWPTILSTVVVCAVLAGVGAVFVVRGQQKNPLPDVIKNQIHFPIFYPSASVVVDTQSYRYDKASGVFSFTGAIADGQVVTFAEQATPDPFNDIPNYYDQFLTKIYEYTAFDSLQGTVHLTHPKGAGQAAVMNAKGTLMFIRVANDEPKATWQQLFDKLVIYSP